MGAQKGMFEGKVALVTGGASGIGRAAAIEFARRGARTVVSDVSPAGEETVGLIRQAGGEAVFVRADVSKGDEVEKLVRGAVASWKRLDFAFNNAGIEGEMLPLAETTEAGFDRIIAVNLKGVWWCMRHELPQMLAQRGGAIVNCSSIAGLVGFAGSGSYVASKHGVVGLTRAAALDYAKAGIRVNAVCPGVIRTPMIDRAVPDPAARAALEGGAPMARIGEPEEIAKAAAWLCSDEASFVTGQAIAVDGGWTVQ